MLKEMRVSGSSFVEVNSCNVVVRSRIGRDGGTIRFCHNVDEFQSKLTNNGYRGGQRFRGARE